MSYIFSFINIFQDFNLIYRLIWENINCGYEQEVLPE